MIGGINSLPVALSIHLVCRCERSRNMHKKPTIALDADGVLLDYHQAYHLVWQKTFGVLPELAVPQAYFP
jgi:hypothetical protein